MTNEEAINVLNDYDINFERHTAEEIAEAHEMAIEALKPQSNERTETHECDCISRKAVLDALHRYFADGFNSDKWWNSTYVLDAVNKVPSTTPQPKTGHWTHDGSYWKNRWICSECGYKLYDEQSKYCPNCGCRMQEVKK
jgi:rubrerythrin